LIAIEAKAGEPLGPTVSAQIRSVRAKHGSRIPERVDLLTEALFGVRLSAAPDGDATAGAINELRYQLLDGIMRCRDRGWPPRMRQSGASHS
jgi:hypothetical protein